MTKNCVCHTTSYLCKHTPFECVFCCTSLKWWQLQILFIFSKFWSSRLLGRMGGGGGKGQKMARNDKKFWPTPYFRNCTSYDCGFWHTCVKWWYLLQFFFFFSKFWFFRFFKVHQEMPKGNSEVCPTFFTCV